MASPPEIGFCITVPRVKRLIPVGFILSLLRYLLLISLAILLLVGLFGSISALPLAPPFRLTTLEFEAMEPPEFLESTI